MRMRSMRSLFGMAALGLSALAAAAQSPPQPLPLALPMPTTEPLEAQPPKPPDAKAPPKIDPKAPPKIDPKKDDKKKDEPKKAPPPVLDVPPVTLPANAAPVPNVPLDSPVAPIQISSLPPVYGDLQLFGMYTPYLYATPPGGTPQLVRPGQVATFPLGTTFNDPTIQTQIVRVQTGTTTIAVPVTGTVNAPPTTVTIPHYTNMVQVVGPGPQPNSGGIPVNIVRGAFVIYENESPRPQDRLYVDYNYFSNVNPTLLVPGLPTANVNRWTFGAEKTFLDGNASVELRLPLLETSGLGLTDSQGLGDVSVVLKYAFINDYIANADGSISPGNALSGGLVITAPTGGAIAYSAQDPLIHSTMIQPWIGGTLVRGNAFLQGFSSIAIATDARDTTYFFNSVQLGYLLYQAPPCSSLLLTSFTPVIEAHVITPLNNRGLDNYPVGAVDQVSFTAGGTFGLGRRAWLNLGVNAPVTGPKPYNIEALAQLNFSY